VNYGAHRLCAWVGIGSYAIALLNLPGCAVTSAGHARYAAIAPNQTSLGPVPQLAPGSVTIFRDQWGVPHIYAAREADGFFGAGYALASDDLVAILRAYLEVSGQSAAVFGPSAVKSDVAADLWRTATDAQQGYKELPAQIRADDRAFVDGIRRFMLDNPSKVPRWAPALDDWMPLAVSHALATLISVYQTREGLTDCHLPADEQPTLFLGQHETTHSLLRTNHSNEWVLAPRRVRINATVVWADSHSDFSWSRDEITIHAGHMNVAGFVQAGMAFPLIGHNENVAWALTSGGPDVSDCYRISMDPVHPNRYRYDGAWRRLITSSVAISVKGAAATRRKLEYFEQNGRLNPVIASQNGAVFAIATAYAGVRAAIAMEEQVYEMDKAKDMAAFIDANRKLGMFPDNIMAGDRFGRTYYVSIGRVPRRDPGIDWSQAVSGNTSRTQWRGIHPLEDLIQIDSPEVGWMQNNNVAPDTMFLHSRIKASAYPKYIFDDTPGRTDDRGERAKYLLSRSRDTTIKQVVAMGVDEYWIHTPQWQRALRSATKAVKLPGDQQALVDRLLAFDGVAHRSSREALQWYLWCEAVADVARLHGLNEAVLAGQVHDGRRLSERESALLREALPATLGSMERLGGPDRTLGDVVKIGRGHTALPLGGVSIDQGIANAVTEDTIRGVSCKWSDDGRICFATFGQRHPMLTVFTSPLQAFSAVPFGQSSDPLSPHYSDQSILESRRQLKADYFEWSQLRTHTLAAKSLSVPQP
jgi:acyl-homoserine-lactone acylase